MSELRGDSRGHETRDISAGGVGCFAIVLVLGGALVLLLIGGMFWRLNEHFRGGAATRITSDRIDAPEPKLQADPEREMGKFRGREDAILNSYGWVDRGAGIARIPIERAMDLIVQRGLSPTPNTAGKTPLQMQQEKATEAKP